MRKKFSIFVKYVISFGLLGALFLKTNFEQLLESIYKLKTETLVLVAILYFFAIFISSFKWFLLLSQFKILDLFKLNLIGNYYSLILPGQLTGDLVKAYKMGKGQKDAEQIAVSVLIDKITGVIGLFIVGIIGVFLTNAGIPSSIGWILLIGTISGVLILLSINFTYIYNIILDILLWFSKKTTRFKQIIRRGILLINTWRDYSRKIVMISLSVIIGVIFQVVVVMISFILARELDINLPFIDWCWILGVVSLIVLLPFTIGGIGLREGAFIGILGWLGVSSEKALALSLSVFALQIIGALVGAFFDFTMKIERR